MKFTGPCCVESLSCFPDEPFLSSTGPSSPIMISEPGLALLIIFSRAPTRGSYGCSNNSAKRDGACKRLCRFFLRFCPLVYFAIVLDVRYGRRIQKLVLQNVSEITKALTTRPEYPFLWTTQAGIERTFNCVELSI